MQTTSNQRLLIISNNVLSTTNNNGKTILSYIDYLPYDSVRQLYFSNEIPEISEYKYFRISDNDVLKKRFKYTQTCGGSLVPVGQSSEVSAKSSNYDFLKNTIMRLLREAFWVNIWKTNQLLSWLDDFHPTAIFFVGGDSLFAYRISEFITKRYQARLTLFITDDYVLPRKHENFIHKYRRGLIHRQLKNILSIVDMFYTISQSMQQAYQKMYRKNSSIIMNLTKSLKEESLTKMNNRTTLVYTGSLYYGRDEVLGVIADAIAMYNRYNHQQIEMKVYSNACPTNESRTYFEKNEFCIYGGSLNQNDLKHTLNSADILVFVESFEEEQVDKTRYSLSTKIPEYMSVRKPILAVGPKDIGSMMYLNDVALCVYDLHDIQNALFRLINTKVLQNELASRAEEKFIKNHNKILLQKEFHENVFGVLKS